MADANNNGIDDALEQQGGNWLQSLLPRSMGGIFDMLFWGLLLAIGGYFLFQIPAVRDWIQENAPMIATGINGLTGGRLFPDAVDQMVGNMTDVEARAQMVQQGIPESIANIVAENPQAWADFRSVVRGANGGRIGNVDAFTNTNTIFTLMTQQPGMARRITAEAIRLAGQNTGQPNPMLQRLLANVGEIFNDPQRMAILLNAQHRTNTLNLLRSASPIQFGEAAFNRFVETVGISNGQLTQPFKDFVNAALTASGQTPADAQNTFYSAFVRLLASPGMENHAAEIAALMQSARFPGGMESQHELAGVLSNPNTAAATIQLIQQLEGAQAGTTARVVALLNAGNTAEALQTPGLLSALLAWRDRVAPNASSLPPQWKHLYDELRGIPAAVAPAVEQLMQTEIGPALAAQEPTQPISWREYWNDDTRTLNELSRIDRFFVILTSNDLRGQLTQDGNLARFGDVLRSSQPTDPRARLARDFLAYKNERNEYVNLNALTNFFNTVNGNTNNQTPQRQEVLYAVYRLVQGDARTFSNLDPEVVAAFMRENADAMRSLLRQLDYRGLPAPYQQFFIYLREHWDGQPSTAWEWAGGRDNQRTHGFREVLTSREGVTIVQDALGGRWTWDNFVFSGSGMPHDNADYLSRLSELADAIKTYNERNGINGYQTAEADRGEAVSPVAAPAGSGRPNQYGPGPVVSH